MIPGPEKDNTIFIILGLAAIAIIAIGAYIYLKPAPQSEENPWVSGGEEALSPNATAIIVLSEKCTDCDSAARLVEKIRQDSANLGTNIVDIQTAYDSSEDGRMLIIRYNITELPALILKKEGQWDGRLLSMWVDGIGSVEDDGSLLYREVAPPYVIVESGETIGMVEAVEIVPESCEGCFDSGAFLDSLEGYPDYVHFTEVTRFNESNPGARALIEKYNITKLPVVILNPGIGAYKVSQQLQSVGSQEDDGWLVLREIPPPYYDVASATVRGRVEIILLKDGSCPDCYDAAAFSDDLANIFGMQITNRTEYDVSSPEGRALISRYAITAAPTFLVSGEASAYRGFGDFWFAKDNTKESDGWYVFRDVNYIGVVYKNINESGTG
ncbi:hypothetical protein H0O02_03120 [Candidatus Micrarchaeota archaeon]|nr:hypothetical protein [Candidatus Micrarchaeota archaeon]